MPEISAGGLSELVNRLTQELAEARRSLASAQHKLGSASRSLEARSQELAEARAALALLLATLDSTTDGILAMGYFGRAMHYNARFIEMWRIPADMLGSLNESALLAIQLSQVKDPQGFLAEVEARKAHGDQERVSVIELTDGRLFEWHLMPQRVRGKRVGSVTSYHDVTERERLGRLVSVLEAQLPSRAVDELALPLMKAAGGGGCVSPLAS
jgi:PAS domain-containing protein